MNFLCRVEPEFPAFDGNGSTNGLATPGPACSPCLFDVVNDPRYGQHERHWCLRALTLAVAVSCHGSVASVFDDLHMMQGMQLVQPFCDVGTQLYVYK